MARSLVDTNILIYSRDLNEPLKRASAIELIDRLGASGELVLSVQCLNESLTGATTTAALTAVERYCLSFLGRGDLGHRARRGCPGRSF